MRFNQWKAGLFAGLALTAQFAWSEAPTPHEQLKVPQCLASKMDVSYNTLAENSKFKIIDIPSENIDDLAKLAEKVRCGRFVNVTHQLESEADQRPTALQLLVTPDVKTLTASGESYELRHFAEVEAAVAKVDSDNIWQTLTHLTAYYNRSSTKDTGVEAAEWLQSQFEKMAVEYGREDTATYFVKTGRYYKQPSLVTVIGKDIKAPAVVLGAHMDTLDGRMPGAGDDGSGSSSVMEAARVLLSSETPLKRPVYIIWYAAEERGLVGSQYVVRDFLKQSIPVKAALQLDMTGFRNDANDRTIWVYRDYTDRKLSDFLAELIKTYVKVPVDYSRCGYGCSDHASWMEKGIPAVFPCETNFEDHNPYIHSPSDTMALLSLDHMTNFSKLALAFAIELASE